MRILCYPQGWTYIITVCQLCCFEMGLSFTMLPWLALNSEICLLVFRSCVTPGSALAGLFFLFQCFFFVNDSVALVVLACRLSKCQVLGIELRTQFLEGKHQLSLSFLPQNDTLSSTILLMIKIYLLVPNSTQLPGERKLYCSSWATG